MRPSPERCLASNCRLFLALCLIFVASTHPQGHSRDVDCGGPFTVGPEVRVTDDPASSYRPSLVWTGIECGVSWQDVRDYRPVGCGQRPAGRERRAFPDHGDLHGDDNREQPRRRLDGR
jgi:hypothetical protein